MEQKSLFDPKEIQIRRPKINFKPTANPKLCDHRCMGAKGPDCSCKCGGKNHGIYRY